MVYEKINEIFVCWDDIVKENCCVDYLVFFLLENVVIYGFVMNEIRLFVLKDIINEFEFIILGIME